jgi:hypothetical protein
MIKDAGEQPNEEIWKGVKHSNFCPFGVGVLHPSKTWMCNIINPKTL